jgi:hypothetical protein
VRGSAPERGPEDYWEGGAAPDRGQAVDDAREVHDRAVRHESRHDSGHDDHHVGDYHDDDRAGDNDDHRTDDDDDNVRPRDDGAVHRHHCGGAKRSGLEGNGRRALGPAVPAGQPGLPGGP